MKYLYIYICFCFTPFLAQVRSNLILSFGTIRHEVSTSSLTNRIKGKPAFDILPEIRLEFTLPKKSIIEIGLQNPSLTTKFYINQNSQWDESSAEEKIILQKSGYFRLLLTYKYDIQITRNSHVLLFVGPGIVVNRFVGLDYSNATYNSLPNQQGFYVDYYYKYDVFKTQRFAFSSLFGMELKSKLGKRTDFVFRCAYNKGFSSFNETRIESFIFNNVNDKADLHYTGSGISATLGLSYNLTGHLISSEKFKD